MKFAGFVSARNGGTKILHTASLILSTFVSLRPLILQRLRFVVACTAYDDEFDMGNYVDGADSCGFEFCDVCCADSWISISWGRRYRGFAVRRHLQSPVVSCW
jgi:hypothetical protein